MTQVPDNEHADLHFAFVAKSLAKGSTALWARQLEDMAGRVERLVGGTAYPSLAHPDALVGFPPATRQPVPEVDPEFLTGQLDAMMAAPMPANPSPSYLKGRNAPASK